MNGIRIHCTDEEIVHLGLSIASGTTKYEDVLDWIYKHE